MTGRHDSIIAEAAKAALRPLGLHRKGRSRLWIGDHGWWLALVEFQPSGFSKGSYLNVAAHWLWTNKGGLSFDYNGSEHGVRVPGFIAFESEDQFKLASEWLADRAAQEVQKLTASLTSIQRAAELLLGQEESWSIRRGGWPTYNAGVAAGLAGRSRDANAMLRAVTAAPAQEAAEHYIDLVSDPERFRGVAISIIGQQREGVGLSRTWGESFE